MEKIISLKTVSDLNDYENFDSYLVESVFSFASQYVFKGDELLDLINDIHSLNKKIYLRADKILVESEIDELNNYIEIFNKVDGIFFEDFAFVTLFLNNNIESQLIYYPYDALGDRKDVEAILSTRIDKVCLPYLKNYLLEKVDLSNVGYRLISREVLFNTRRKILSLYNDINNVSIKENRYFMSEKTRTSIQEVIETRNGALILNDVNISDFNSDANFCLVDTLFVDEDKVNEVLKMIGDR